MLFMGRHPVRIVSAPFQARNYRALVSMLRTYPAFAPALMRYLSNSGSYPHNIRVRTRSGIQIVRLYSYHDLLTINEVFCRGDYCVGPDISVAVDIGANIGISCLYFLTQNPSVRCYAYEPVPRNMQRLTNNLTPFRDRLFIEQAAVADFSGISEFTTEESGRYGGLPISAPPATDRGPTETIQVRCLHINDVVADVLRRESGIDVLKIDTEGNEEAIIRAIDPMLLSRIGIICYEDNGTGCVNHMKSTSHTPTSKA